MIFMTLTCVHPENALTIEVWHINSLSNVFQYFLAVNYVNNLGGRKLWGERSV